MKSARALAGAKDVGVVVDDLILVDCKTMEDFFPFDHRNIAFEGFG